MNQMTDQLIGLAVAMSSPAPEMARLVELHVQANTALQADGRLAVIDIAGNPRLTSGPGYPEMTVVELLAETRQAMPSLFAPSEAEIAAKAATVQAKADITLAARVRAYTAAHKQREAAARAVVDSSVNPFAARTRNVTAQMVLLNKNPALAAKMKAAALAAAK